MSTAYQAATSNRLIAPLPAKVRAQLLAHGEDVALVFGERLAEPTERIRHVYFPIVGFISMITPVDRAATLEVGLAGNEGMFGASLALGVSESPLTALVQGAGSALRFDAKTFQRECMAIPAVQKRLNRYVYVLMSQLAQSAACSRFHVIEARLARWLLMTQDRAHASEFHITHTFLAWMLGVRRAGVTTAANKLQRKGCITYKRGDIVVLNRALLEAHACSCYRFDRDVYDRTLTNGA